MKDPDINTPKLTDDEIVARFFFLKEKEDIAQHRYDKAQAKNRSYAGQYLEMLRMARINQAVFDIEYVDDIIRLNLDEVSI